MSLNSPGFEADVLLDTPDTIAVSDEEVRVLKLRFEALFDQLWSGGKISGVREDLDGVNFITWKREGIPKNGRVDDSEREHTAQRFVTWTDDGVYSTQIGRQALYMYREREYISPLPLSWKPEEMNVPAKLQVIEKRYSVFAMESGKWALAVREGSAPLEPGSPDAPVDLSPEFELYSGTSYRARELADKLTAFSASV